MYRIPVFLLAGCLALAAQDVPATRIFQAEPGVNSLVAARDAVRAWRATGHPDEAVVIQLAPGEYSLTEPLLLTAADGQVTWQAPSPSRTLITGGQHLTGFVADPLGLWHTVTSLHFEQLYVNGQRALRARAPADGFFPIHAVRQQDLANGRALLTITVPPEAIAVLPADPAALTRVELRVYHNWDTTRYRLTSCDRAAGTISVTGYPLNKSNPWTARSWFRLENLGTQVSHPGTWFLDANGALTYYPRPGEHPETTDVVAPVAESLLRMQGANHVSFLGLRFYHVAYTLPPEGDPPAQASVEVGAALLVDDAREVSFENVEIAHTGNYGLWFRRGCQVCRVEHSRFMDLGGGGVRIGNPDLDEPPAFQTGRIVVNNNIIRSCGRDHPSAVGIWIGQSANNRITHNDICDTFYTGISVGWTWGYGPSAATNNFIGYNRIHQIGQGVLSDMGGIYTLGVSPGSAEVGNVIYDVRARDYGGWGIYPDEGSSDWRIENNLVWQCTCVNPPGGGAFHQHYGATNLLVNNVFAFSSGPLMQATRLEDHLSLTLEHNLLLSSNLDFFTGPWKQMQVASRSNCFIYVGAPRSLFPTGDLPAWQSAGHETGSLLTDLPITGSWPDITLPRHSAAAEAVGFQWFDPRLAGVYGTPAWRQEAGMSKLPETTQ